MAPSTVVQRKDKIFELLMDSSVKEIILVGKSGVGKTWTARQVSNRAIREGLFEVVVWVFCNREYHELVLCQSIARQLYLLPIDEEWEAEDGNKKAKRKEENREALQQMIATSLAGKRLLVILDDEGNKIGKEHIMPKLETLLNLDDKNSYKVIITSVKAYTGTKGEIQVDSLSVKESLSLLREKVGRKVYEVPAIKNVAERFIKKTKNLPASIILMAKAFSYFGQDDSGAKMLEGALNEASDSESYNITQLLRSGYDVLPKSVLIDCCGRGSHLFRYHGSIHYNELIAYWILEGYLGHVDSVEKAYEKGHSVFMELVDCQVLKKLEGGYAVMDTVMDRNRPIINLDDDSDRYGFVGTASLGLADLFEDHQWEGFGRITHTDGMIKSLRTSKERQKLSTLFLDGNHCAEFLNNSFGSKQELRVLAIFNPTLKSVTQLLSDMHELLVLVLRGCDFLEKIEQKIELKRLTVLEISHAGSLKTIPNDFFEHMPQLGSLHISELKVDPLPSSLYNLTELRRLILRGCSCFKTLKSLENFENLVVLDVSGAASLIKFKDKSFEHTPKLQTLNLSHTRIKDLPKLRNLGQLTHLLLSGCELLDRMPKTESLVNLQTLDLSGARKFKEFHEQSIGLPGSLKILDLSETPLENLPSEINPRHLFLKRCSQLQKLPFIEALKHLEVLDLSGTKCLVEIEDKFFSHLDFLRILNLSETSIKTLPSLSNLNNLQQLLLSGCIALTEIKDESFEKMSCLLHLDLSETKIERLPSLSNLSNLSVLSLKKCTNLKALPRLETLSNVEELNLCGITFPKDTGAEFLQHMSNLRILDLSETQLEQSPSLSNLKSICQLSLRGCQRLKRVPNLEELTRLEVLDLSGTAVTRLPSLDNFSNLRQLLLGGCSSLEGFLHMEMLDLLGTAVRELPYGISKLTHLECLELPNTKSILGDESRNTKSLPEMVDPYQWGISSFDKPTISVNGIQFLQFLKNNPSSLETSLTQFHFCVHPSEGQNKTGDTYFYRNELIFRDIRFQSAEFGCFKDQRTLEIHGFDLFPKGVGDVLCNADCVFFINNKFNKWLSDIGVSSLKAMKGCWIERCTEMECVFHAGKEDDIAELGKTLEILGVSNAINLNSIHSGNLHCQVFLNLICLYLDCCPKLSTVFSSSQMPENLKVLQVKFCDKLERLFEPTLPEPKLQNLETLYLWELPELKTIGCRLPSLQTLKAWECPKLQKLEDTIRLAESLQTLWISNVVDLKSIYSGSQQLETLILENCPMLETLISPHQPTESLKTLKIKSCNKLKTENSTSSHYTLQ